MMLLPVIAAMIAPAGATDFDRMTALVGHWRGTGDGGRVIDIRYSLISNGSALVEEWTSPRGDRTMTIYYRDRTKLLATHFCAQGNQPRLQLIKDAHPGRLRFAFRDATNLTVAASHLHDFWIELGDDGVMRRSESYRQGRKVETEILTLRRVAD